MPPRIQGRPKITRAGVPGLPRSKARPQGKSWGTRVLQPGRQMPGIAPAEEESLYPDWLPLLADGSPPAIFVDFQNGNYWLDGAEVAVGDLLGQDADNWGTFDAETGIVEGSGLQNSVNYDDGAPIILSEALGTLLDDGLTWVFTTYVGDDDIITDPAGIAVQDIPEFVTMLETRHYANVGSDVQLRTMENIGTPTVIGTVAAGLNRIAASITSSRAAASHNGGTVGGETVTPVAVNQLGMSSFVASFVTGFSANTPAPNSFVRSVAIYTLQDEADLPGLSTL